LKRLVANAVGGRRRDGGKNATPKAGDLKNQAKFREKGKRRGKRKAQQKAFRGKPTKQKGNIRRAILSGNESSQRTQLRSSKGRHPQHNRPEGTRERAHGLRVIYKINVRPCVYGSVCHFVEFGCASMNFRRTGDQRSWRKIQGRVDCVKRLLSNRRPDAEAAERWHSVVGGPTAAGEGWLMSRRLVDGGGGHVNSAADGHCSKLTEERWVPDFSSFSVEGLVPTVQDLRS